MRITTIVSLLFSLAAGTGASSVAAQPAPCRPLRFTDTEVMSAVSFSATPASSVWCGNRYRRDDRVNEAGARVAADMPGACVSLARTPSAAVSATERAELRGWIRSEPAPHPEEGEMHFTFEPDYGWTSQSAATAINTPASIVSRLTSIGDNGAGLIKVEINHWEAARACGVQRWSGPLGLWHGTYTSAWNAFLHRGRLCTSYVERRPADWCFPHPLARGAGAEVYAPYDWSLPPRRSDTLDGDRPLRNGDYVRVVGTLWEDNNHGQGGCWTMHGSRTAARGWLELHPVDFIARIPAPVGPSGRVRERSGLTFGGVCVGGDVSGQEGVADFVASPPEPRPGPNWSLRYEEIVASDFTNVRSLQSPYMSVARRATVAGEAVRVRVGVHSGGAWGGRGMYRAAWRVWWEQGPCTNCAAGERCDEGRCCRVSCDQSCGATVTRCATGQACVAHTCRAVTPRATTCMQGCRRRCTRGRVVDVACVDDCRDTCVR